MGHMGRLQQLVVKIPEKALDLNGGRDEEQARQRVVVRSTLDENEGEGLFDITIMIHKESTD